MHTYGKFSKALNSRLCICDFSTIEMDVPKGTISITNPKAPTEAPRTFTYDAVYDWKYGLLIFFS